MEETPSDLCFPFLALVPRFCSPSRGIQTSNHGHSSHFTPFGSWQNQPREEELVWHVDGCHTLSSFFPLASRGTNILWPSSFAVQHLLARSQATPAALPMWCSALPNCLFWLSPNQSTHGLCGYLSCSHQYLEAHSSLLDRLEIQC